MTEAHPTTLEGRAERFAHRLVVALVNLEMRASDHVAEDIERMLDDLRVLARACEPDAVRLEVAHEQLRFGNRPLLRSSLQAGRLLRLCRQRSIAALCFEANLGKDEMHRFLQLLTDDREREAFSPSHLEAALASRGIVHVCIELADRPAERTDDPAVDSHVSVGALRQYQAMADVLHDSHVAGFRGDNLEVNAAAGVVEQAIIQMGDEPRGLLALAMYDDIDQFTVGHSVRVTLLALQVANYLQVPRRDLLRLGTAALLHDIGKSRIPQHILFKQGALDEEERRVMATHARLGGELLLEHGEIDPAAVGAAFCHHMGPGGSGYPEPTLPFEPSGVSRLVRVCDVFEALTSVRPYKAAMSPLHAYAIMHGMKDSFDPRWLRTFISCIGLYPTGSRLTLDTGEEALVVGSGPSLRQPRVRLLSGPDGGALPDGAPNEVTVDVMEHGIVRHIDSDECAGTHAVGHADVAANIAKSHGQSCGCDFDAELRPRDPD